MSQMSIFDSEKKTDQSLEEIKINNLSPEADKVKAKIKKLLAAEKYYELAELIFYDNCSRHTELKRFACSLLPDDYYFNLNLFGNSIKENHIKKYKFKIGQKVISKKFGKEEVKVVSRGPGTWYQVKGGKMGEFDCLEYLLSNESDKRIET